MSGFKINQLVELWSDQALAKINVSFLIATTSISGSKPHNTPIMKAIDSSVKPFSRHRIRSVSIQTFVTCLQPCKIVDAWLFKQTIFSKVGIQVYLPSTQVYGRKSHDLFQHNTKLQHIKIDHDAKVLDTICHRWILQG